MRKTSTSSPKAATEPRDPRLWSARTREIVRELEALARGDRAGTVELLLDRCIEDPELAEDVLGSERHNALMDAALAEVQEDRARNRARPSPMG